MRTPNASVPHNLAYRATEKTGNTFYIFMHRPRPAEKKYISSVTLAVADTITQMDFTEKAVQCMWIPIMCICRMWKC